MSAEVPSQSFRERLAHRVPGLARRLGATAFGGEASRGPESESERVDILGLIDTLPDSLEVGDERVTALVRGINEGSIDYTSDDVRSPDITEDMIDRSIDITTPQGLEEGADKDLWSIPLSARGAVAAPDLDSWAKGRTDGLKRGRSSQDVIKANARMDSRTAPPVQHVTVYAMPDGRTFWTLSGDGAHRVAAAKRRGPDSSVYAQDVTIVKLNTAVALAA